MPTPKDAPYKIKQKKPWMVATFQCPICKKPGGTLRNITVNIEGGPKKIKVHENCVKEALMQKQAYEKTKKEKDENNIA